MTNRERILAVIEERELDRVPFVQYSGIVNNEEVWALVGRDNVGLLQWTALHTLQSPHCRIETEDIEIDGRPGVRHTLITPIGALTEERLYEPAYHSTAAHKHYVQEISDYQILLAYLRDIIVQPAYENYVATDKALGDDGLPLAAVLRTPYQQLWIQWTSLENLAWHLVEAPELMAEVIAELTRIEQQVFEVAYEAAKTLDFRFIDIPDNITAPVIGERYFRQYCLPLYQRLAEMMADFEIKVFCHMDGDLRPLWSAIGESGLLGIDSFSPPPDNDTTVAQALEMWPEIRLFVNFPSSVHLAPPEHIYATAMEILQQGGRSGRLQIQISENVPANAWRTSYPQIIRAIADFTANGRA